MAISAFIMVMLTFLPGLLPLSLGIAPGLGGDTLAIGATWVRAVFVISGSATTILSLRAFAKHLLGTRHDEEAHLRRAPFVGTALTGSGVLLLAVVFGGKADVTGEAAQAFRVLLGVYAVWLVLFGMPAFFARKLQAMPSASGPFAPTACARCGITLAAGSASCAYCGTPVG